MRLAAVVLLLASAAALADEVDDLVERLGSPEFEVREAATDRLASMGRGVVRRLVLELDDPEPERARRAKEILRRIGDGFAAETGLVHPESADRGEPPPWALVERRFERPDGEVRFATAPALRFHVARHSVLADGSERWTWRVYHGEAEFLERDPRRFAACLAMGAVEVRRWGSVRLYLVRNPRRVVRDADGEFTIQLELAAPLWSRESSGRSVRCVETYFLGDDAFHGLPRDAAACRLVTPLEVEGAWFDAQLWLIPD